MSNLVRPDIFRTQGASLDAGHGAWVDIRTIMKINFLIVGLGLTIYLAYHLRHNGLGEPAKVILGLEGDGPGDQRPKTEIVDMNWCHTRVKALEFPNEFVVSQEGRKWVFTLSSSGEKRELNFLEVEKWLAKYCKVDATIVNEQISEAFVPVLSALFLDKSNQTFLRNPAGEIAWKGTIYKSQKFLDALRDLRLLAGMN